MDAPAGIAAGILADACIPAQPVRAAAGALHRDTMLLHALLQSPSWPESRHGGPLAQTLQGSPIAVQHPLGQSPRPQLCTGRPKQAHGLQGLSLVPSPARPLAGSEASCPVTAGLCRGERGLEARVPPFLEGSGELRTSGDLLAGWGAPSLRSAPEAWGGVAS